MIQHLSVRVPWHDNGWNGTVCNEPCSNASCLALKGILENRNDINEQNLCGQCLVDIEEQVPCISEGSAFMSPYELVREVVHPYKFASPKTHSHFKPTHIRFPAFSFPSRPYWWLMKDNVINNMEVYGIDYDERREPHMDFKTIWVQEKENQKAVFDAFYQNVKEHKSLVVAYAKKVPFVDENRRIIIGMGFVSKVVPAVEHESDDKRKHGAMTWETMLCHTIRENNKDGFVIPYQKMLEYQKEKNPDFDMNSITVYAPVDAFDEFSYGTEHISYDALIDVIMSCIKSFEIINSCLDEDYSTVLEWLNARLSEVWQQRGAFPGLGAMLTALDVQMGMLLANDIIDSYDEKKDFWNHFDNVLLGQNDLISKVWKALKPERKNLFKLLSRFSLSVEQAKMLFQPDERLKANVLCSDFDIINNPYVIYEKTRLKLNGYISVRKIDRAMFPPDSIGNKHPVPVPSKMDSTDDQRRVRALAVSVLEEAALEGHTILPWHLFIGRIKDTVLEPACSVTTDKLSALELFMKDEIIKKLMKDGSDYYKLVRLQEFDDVIEKRVGKRLKAKPLSINADWRKLLDEEFDKGEKKVIDSDEELARIEKAAALNVLATSRISVLAGDAGTGKTTVLSVLCKHKEIAAGGILLMAPTGKATVRLKEAMSEKNISYEAMNVAQFLNKSKRYCAEDMRYTLSKIEGANEKETIIIDEASMLTEEMFGALMESIGKAKRIIFVGDPNQLTPIGSGCPFVDLVNLLRDKVTKNFPVVTDNYAELTINRRQADSEERLDVELAKTFTRNNLDSDKSIIAEIIKKPNDKIKFIRWTDRAELEDKLLEIIKDTAGMSSVDDVKGFDKFLGGTEKDGYMYFNLGAAKMIEKWQILAPVKNMPQGVININRLIHQKYRKNFIDLANKKGYQRRIPKALGSDGIVYGDKVINVINNGRDSYPKGLENYVANGEIGIACKCFYKRGSANYLNVEFSSKQGMTFSYDYRDFSEESGVDFLELAYALTVHKAQGSQFDTVILVLAEPCRIISRELIYTALSRQRANIVILYNDEPHKLMKYASNEYSDIARRFTDLFVGSRDKEHYPQVVEVNGKFYDENKIHRTARNEMVRSKSEVIIANSLDKHGIPYSYEKELILDGIRKVPDFTIEDGDAGEIWYWEHCGMMDVEKYRKNWESKKAFYAAHGIVEGENLIVTYEDGNGLDSYEIDKLVKSKFEDMIY